MNKTRYRTVFNKKRGLLMAVSENATSTGRGRHNGSSPAASGHTPEPVPPLRLRPLALAALYLFSLIQNTAFAAVVADPAAAGNKRPIVDAAANGVPLVQIATPNTAGLSHNQYSQFNVDPSGAILNNSAGAVQTQLGGYVNGNPFLAGGSARIILNEVTGTGASSLRGYTEVAGQRAEVIIANPNGITCNGCGFINTSRGVLTTGTPVFGGGGSLDAFRVTGGQIQIGAGGLNGANTDQLDLISRSLQVNGQLWGNNLNAVTGANQVNYATLGVQVIQGDANKPTVGIDVALLGGMYANKIRLVGTEAGVGVTSLGAIAAHAGDLNIDNTGRITLNGNTGATGNLTVNNTEGFSNSGTLYASQNAQISSAADIANSGTLAAQGNLALSGTSLASTGSLGAGITSSGSIAQNGNLTVSATGRIDATGQNLAGGNLTLGGSFINLANSRTGAGGNASVNASAGDIDVSGGQLQAAGTLTLNASANIRNDAGQVYGGLLTATAASLSNRAGTLAQTGNGTAALTLTGALDNTSGKIGSNLDLSISASTITGNGQVIAGRDAAISLQGNYTNAAGNQIATNRNLSLAMTGNFTNTGTLKSVNNLSLSAANIANQGTLQGGGLLSANTGSLTNTASIIGGSVSLTASQSIVNSGPSALIGASDTAGLLELLGPVIQNRDDTTATDTAAQTTILGLGQVVLAGSKNAAGQYGQATQALNQSGLIQSGGNLSVYANTLTNTRRVLQMGAAFTQTGATVGKVANWYGAPTTTPGGQPANWAIGGGANSSYVYTIWMETAYQNNPLAISPAAQIVAGGALNPAVTTLQNYWSHVSAGGNIGLTGVTLDQNSWRGAQAALTRTVNNGAWWYLNYQGFMWTPSGSFSQTIDTPQTGYDSTFTANGAIAGTGATVTNTAGSSAQTPPGSQTSGGGSSSQFTLPSGGLYTIHTSPGQKYLVETNPAFTNYQQWLSSDWYFQRAGVDPANVQKRLGDGFYEQQLVRNQMLSLTGRAVLGGYAGEEAQFRDMMTSGAELARALSIRPGIGLTAAQAAQLTSNVVIMETRVVNGESVLVPVVYLAAGSTELRPNGALIAASDISLTDLKGYTNSGVVKADHTLALSGQSLDNRGGTLASGGAMSLDFAHNIDLTSAALKAGSLQLNAGNDLILGTDAKQVGMDVSVGSRTTTLMGRTGNIDVAGDASIATGRDFQQNGGSLSVGGNLAASIGHDWNLGTQQFTESAQGAAGGTQFSTTYTRNLVSNVNVGGQSAIRTGNDFTAQGAQLNLAGGGSLQAGGNVTLGAVKDQIGHDSTSAGGGHYGRNQSYDETVVGTNINSGNSLAIVSNKDITLAASTINLAQGNATLAAAGDVKLQTVAERHQSLQEDSGSQGNFFHSVSKDTRTTYDGQQAIGSALSADSVNVVAGKDIGVTGSSIAGTGDVSLNAGDSIDIQAATNSYSQTSYSHTSESGFMSNGGLSVSFGNREQTDQSAANGSLQSQSRSMVGSINGNLGMVAGKDAHVAGSDLFAGRDLNVLAQSITLDPGLDRNAASQSHDMSQSGLTLSITNPVVSAIETAQQMRQAASQTKDSRTKALAAATTALAAKNAYDAVSKSDAPAGGINVSISLGSSSSHSESQQQSADRFGSSASAGHDLSLVATGAGKDSNLTAVGADIRAGNNAVLIADNQVNLLAAQSTSSQTGSNSSNSASIGVGFSVGAKSGFTLDLAASHGSGNSNGHDVINVNTHAAAGNQLALSSGGDANLIGATASGKQVIADVGGNLNLASLQDTSTYQSKQDSAGFSVSIPITGTGFGASANMSNSHINNDYASVREQSGIKAGDGGFNVNVAGNTDLKASVIESTAQAVKDGNNHLSTGTLTTGNLQNRANFNGESMSLGVSYTPGEKGSKGGASSLLDALSAAPPMALSAEGSAQSTTGSGISGGDISITNEAKQKQLTGKDAAATVASINRDVATGQDTSGALANNFNAQEIQAGFAVTQAFVQQSGTFLANRAAETAAAQQAIKEENLKAKPDQAVIAQANKVIADNKTWDMGGTGRTIMTALTAGASGNVTGGMGQFVQAAAVNYLQSLGVQEVKKIADSFRDDKGNTTNASETVRTALQGLVACAGASAQGANCGAAAMGASASVVLNNLMGGDPNSMSAADKENRKNIVATLVAGIATAAGASGGDVTTATNSATMETANNGMVIAELMVAGAAGARVCWAISTCRLKMVSMGFATLGALETYLGHNSPGKPADPLPPDLLPGTPNDGAQQGTTTTTPADTQTAQGTPGYAPTDPSATGGTTTTRPNNGPQGATVVMSDGRLPISGTVTAGNGLQVQSNSKHTPGMPGFNINAGVEPRNSLDLFNNSIPDPKDPSQRYAIDLNGNLHRFSGKNGPYHWTGSTGDVRNPLNSTPVPIEVRRALGYKGK